MAGGAAHHVPSGLTDVEARERLRRFGPNRLPEPPRKHALALLIEVLDCVLWGHGHWSDSFSIERAFEMASWLG